MRKQIKRQLNRVPRQEIAHTTVEELTCASCLGSRTCLVMANDVMNTPAQTRRTDVWSSCMSTITPETCIVQAPHWLLPVSYTVPRVKHRFGCRHRMYLHILPAPSGFPSSLSTDDGGNIRRYHQTCRSTRWLAGSAGRIRDPVERSDSWRPRFVSLAAYRTVTERTSLASLVLLGTYSLHHSNVNVHAG